MKKENYFISDFFKYMIAAVCCAVAGVIYHKFSHGVYSFYMGYMFIVPVIFGAIPSILLYFLRGRLSLIYSRILLCAGIVTLTLGMFLTGVFEIYGTRAELLVVHWVVGAMLVVASVFAGIFEKILMW